MPDETPGDDGHGFGQGYIRVERLRAARLDLRGGDDRSTDERGDAGAARRAHLPHAFGLLLFEIAPANDGGVSELTEDTLDRQVVSSKFHAIEEQQIVSLTRGEARRGRGKGSLLKSGAAFGSNFGLDLAVGLPPDCRPVLMGDHSSAKPEWCLPFESTANTPTCRGSRLA